MQQSDASWSLQQGRRDFIFIMNSKLQATGSLTGCLLRPPQTYFQTREEKVIRYNCCKRKKIPLIKKPLAAFRNSKHKCLSARTLCSCGIKSAERVLAICVREPQTLVNGPSGHITPGRLNIGQFVAFSVIRQKWVVLSIHPL